MAEQVKIETEAQKQAQAEAEAAKKAEAEAAKEVEAKSPKKVWTVKTSVEGFNGTSLGITFKDSVGETDNAWFAQRAKAHGFKVK